MYRQEQEAAPTCKQRHWAAVWDRVWAGGRQGWGQVRVCVLSAVWPGTTAAKAFKADGCWGWNSGARGHVHGLTQTLLQRSNAGLHKEGRVQRVYVYICVCMCMYDSMAIGLTCKYQL